MKKKYVLYGLNKFENVLREIRDDFKDLRDFLTIELILSEAVSNAFKHGNKYDENMPINIYLLLKGDILRMEVEDSGPGFEKVVIPTEIKDEDLLAESGRGLFLINCYADQIQIVGSRIIIEKVIK